MGDSGTILKSIDGGVTWNSVLSGITSHLFSICFPEATIGYIVGSGGSILKITSGTLSVLSSGTSNDLYSVFFTDANNGYAVGDFETIIKTSDGGQTWTSVSSGIYFCNFTSVVFTDAGTGYIAGSSTRLGGRIFKTIDSGATWIDITGVGGNWIISVYFTDTNTGYVVGDPGIILKTINAGESWTVLSSGTNNQLYSAVFTDATTGYVVGSCGTILKTTNGGESAVGIIEPPLQTNISQNNLKMYPNPANEKITIESSASGSKLNGTISLIGMDGQELINQKVQGSRVEINVNSLLAGIYFIRLVNNDKIEFGKFIKE